MIKQHLLTGLLLLLMVPLAHSVPIVSQPVLEDGTSLGTLSSLSAGSQPADNFSLGQEFRITGLSWWGSYETAATGDDFNVRFFSDVGGLPSTMADILNSASPAFSRTVLPGVTDDFGSQIYRYDLALNLVLGAGDYYLSILNDADEDWFWADAISGDLANWFRVTDGDVWADSGESYDLAYVLDGAATTQGTIPEPGSLALWLIGFGGLLSIRRRQSLT